MSRTKDDLQLISNNPISNEEIIQRQLNEIASYYENIPVGLALLDTDLRFLRVNNLLAAMNGVPAEEHIGKTIGEIIPSLELPAKQLTETIISTGKPVVGIEISGEIATQPGFVRTCLESWYPVLGDNNKIVGFTVIVQDITEQKQAADALRKKEMHLNMVMETNKIGAWILNLADNTVYHSLTHDIIFGYDKPQPDWSFETFIEHVLLEDRKKIINSMHDAISKQSEWKLECQIRRADGEIRWISATSKTEIDTEGNPSHLLGIVQDITEHKQAEEKLHVSENLLKSLANNLPNVVLFQMLGDWEGNRKVTYISDAVSRVNEVSVEAVMNDANVLLSQMLPEYIPGLKIAEEKAVREGKILHYEFQSRLPSGRIRWFELSSFITVLSENQGMSEGVQIDITERKQIEEALQKSEVKYRRLFESMTDAYAATDMVGRIIEFNPAFQAMLGYSNDEFKRMSYKDFTPQRWYDFESDIIQDQILTNKHSKLYEKEYIRRDGSIIPVELRTFIITDDAGQQIGLCAIVRDITERKQIEEALQKSEVKYRRLVESMTDAYAVTDMEGHILECNPAYQAMLGYSNEELKKMTYHEFTPAKWHDLESRIVSEQVLKNKHSEVYEKEHIHKNSTIFPVELKAFLITDDTGQPTGMCAIVRDITKRKQIEEALQKSEVKYRRLFESMTDAYAARDMEGHIIEYNPAYQAMLGYSDEELKRMQYKDFTPQRWHDFESDIIQDQILNNKYSKLYEKEYIRSDGSIFPVELRTFIMTDDAGQQMGLCAIVRDITERKQAEERLNNYNAELEKQVAERTAVAENRASKLQTLSRRLIMAEETERQRIAYVLHEEVQQILVAARMALNTGIMQIKDAAPQIPLAVVDRMLNEAITETRELVHQIVPPALYESGLQDAVKWLSKQMRERYDFIVDVITNEKITNVDDEVSICAYQAIREMLLNIHKHANVKQAEVTFYVMSNNRFELTVKDKGTGFAIKEIQDATDSNKGFGLFSIRERVEGLGGGIKIVSAIGKGTSISLYLPMNMTGTNKKNKRS
ncbi:MAG: PAS domain S-box protein [bacterium]